MENQQDKPIALRINITNDNHSISHSEWLKCNDEFKDLGIVFEISDKGYPSMVMTPYNLTYIDIASWVAIGKEGTEKEVYKRLSVCLQLQIYATSPIPSMDNVIDLYMTPQSGHYYLDSECSNAVLLMITGSPFPIPELRDRIIQSFKGNTHCYKTMMMIDCGRESHNIAIGRIKRMTSLCFFQMGIPINHHLIEDVYISYIDDDDNIPSIIYIY